MNKILEELDRDITNTRTDLDSLVFSPILNPDSDLNALIDEYFSFNDQRSFLEDRLAALQALRPLLLDAIEVAAQEKARQEQEAQRVRDAARIEELMAELDTMEPGAEYSLKLMEISKLNGGNE